MGISPVMGMLAPRVSAGSAPRAYMHAARLVVDVPSLIRVPASKPASEPASEPALEPASFPDFGGGGATPELPQDMRGATVPMAARAVVLIQRFIGDLPSGTLTRPRRERPPRRALSRVCRTSGISTHA